MRISVAVGLLLVCMLSAGAADVEAPAVKPAKAPAVRYGHNADYSRISGRLIWADIEGGHWQIRFIDPAGPAAAKDKYRGRFTLGTPKLLKGFKAGEWVTLTGRPRPDMATIWQTGTLYEVKTVRRLGPAPKVQPLDPKTAKLVARADRMHRERRRFPADFQPAKDLKVTWSKTKRELLFLLRHFKDRRWSPRIIDDQAAAKAAVEKHIAADTGNYVHSFRKRKLVAKDERIVKSQATDLYFRFDSTFSTKDRTDFHMVYLVLRPAFLAEVTGQHTVWRRNGGRGLVFGKQSRGDLAAFTKAADLLAYLMLKDERACLLGRKTKKKDLYRWSGLLAYCVKGPTSPRDWRFETLVIEVNPDSGRVVIKTVPANRPAGGDEPKVEAPWTTIVGHLASYRRLKVKEVLLRGKMIVERDKNIPDGAFSTRPPVNYFLKIGKKRILLGPPMDAKFRPLADKQVEVKGKMRPLRRGSREKFLWVGWIREVIQ